MKAACVGTLLLLLVTPGLAYSQGNEPVGLQAWESSTDVTNEQSPRLLSLHEAMDLALKNNRQIGLAHQDTKHFEELKAKARSDYFPKIVNNSAVSHVTDRQNIALPSGALGTVAGTQIPPVTVRIDQGSKTTYFSTTQLSQALTELFGIREENRAAAADVRRSTAEELTVALDVAASVHRTYYTALVANRQARAARASEIAAQENYDETEARLRLGSALLSDVLSAKVKAKEAQTAFERARTEERDAQDQLESMLMLPVATPLLLEEPPEPPPALQGFPPRREALALALQNNPVVLAAEQVVVKAKSGVTAAKDTYIPVVAAIAREDYQNGVPFLLHNFGTFEGVVSINVFDGGRRRAMVKDANSLLTKSQIALDQTRDQIRVRLEVAYNQAQQAELELETSRVAQEAAIEKEREVIAQFNHGELLASEKDAASAMKLAADASFSQASMNVVQARVQIDLVLGQIPR